MKNFIILMVSFLLGAFGLMMLTSGWTVTGIIIIVLSVITVNKIIKKISE
jgi:hypothetical protein